MTSEEKVRTHAENMEDQLGDILTSCDDGCKGDDCCKDDEKGTCSESDNNIENKEKCASESKVNELTLSLQRLQAEFENYKKRMDRDSTQFMKLANKELIVKLLPLLDNFELAFKSAEHQEEFKRGIELIYTQMVETLEKEGLKKIDTVGNKFSPYLHEALLSEKAEKEKDDNNILQELQKGYILNDAVIRHAKVKVAKK